MADVDHPKTHVEDQDVDLPRKQPESPKHEGIDPLTESDTMYPRENVKSNAAQQELNAQANTPNSLLDNTENGGAAEDFSEETQKTDEEVAKDSQPIEDGDLEDKETGTQNTSPSNKTTDETAQDDVKDAERKVSSKTPKR